MVNLAPITSAATLKLIIYRLQGMDDKPDADLAKELGISMTSLWRARKAVASLDLSPLPSVEEERVEFSREAEAAAIDEIEPTGKVGQPRTGADIRRRKLRLFVAEVWREKVPDGEKLTAAQVDDLAKVAEQNSRTPAALLLDKIATFALMHAGRVQTNRHRYLRAMLVDKPKPHYVPAPTKKWEPLPGEAATVDEAIAERARISREWIEANKPKRPVILKFAVDEEDDDE